MKQLAVQLLRWARNLSVKNEDLKEVLRCREAKRCRAPRLKKYSGGSMAIANVHHLGVHDTLNLF